MHIVRITEGEGEGEGEKVDELHIDTRFVVSYRAMGLTPQQTRTVEGMIRSAIDVGKRIRSKEFKDLIGN
jgi:hypothetical protein